MLGIVHPINIRKRGQYAVRLVLCAFLIVFALGSSLQAAMDVPDIPSIPAVPEGTEVASNGLEPLFLEVTINEQATNLIASFYRSPEGKIGASAAELNEIGVRTPETAEPADIIFLSDIPTVLFQYNEDTQLLNINIVDDQRLAKQYHTSDGKKERLLTPSGIGAVINYSLFATSAAPTGGTFEIGSTSANLDGWIYSPLGRIYGSGIVSTDNFNEYEFLRLDTRWSFSDVKSLKVYNLGDTISGGLAWTRPVRMGGFQVQKNFGLRPDLISTPLLQATGSAAVPSTVDVYIGNFKAHSQEVSAGPFSINQIPTVSGAGNARIVIKDATGREQETIKPFYVSSKLLRKGLLDYSLEAGFARLNYGSISNNYSRDILGLGTFRYGFSDTVTLEGHAEGNANLLNGGLGASFTLANRALFSVAGSASQTSKGLGYQAYGSVETQLWGLNIHASSRRSFGDYQDLASITESEIVDTGFTSGALTTTGIPKAFDQISIGIPLPKIKGGLNLSFTHLEDVVNSASNVVSASYSQRVFGDASLTVSAFSAISDEQNYGVYVGLSFPLGNKIHTSASVESTDGNLAYRVAASKSADSIPGSWGWRISDTEGYKQERSAGVSYRGKKTYSQINVHQNVTGVAADAYLNGAVVVADSGVFFANRIDDAFAVVDTGVPSIPVYLANHLMGETNAFGKLLVPGLLSYEENRIKIDTEKLPINASVDSTNQKIIPASGAGVNIRFGVQTDTKNAVVIFTDAQGEYLDVGAEGILSGSGSEFIIGYDGRTYLEGLSSKNTVTIVLDNSECIASFAYTAAQDEQVEVGPVVCQ